MTRGLGCLVYYAFSTHQYALVDDKLFDTERTTVTNCHSRENLVYKRYRCVARRMRSEPKKSRDRLDNYLAQCVEWSQVSFKCRLWNSQLIKIRVF